MLLGSCACAWSRVFGQVQFVGGILKGPYGLRILVRGWMFGFNGLCSAWLMLVVL
jgi:hypothetical protein